MKTIAKILVGLAILVVLMAVGTAITLQMIDADKYRPQIIEALNQQTGRTVSLGGPITFGLSWHGAILTIQDAAIGNPVWASRPVMAGIGHFELGVAIPPLLSHQLVITEFNVVNADIQLETSATDKHNWEGMGSPAYKNATSSGVQKASVPSDTPLSTVVDHFSILDSQLAIRDKDGNVTTVKIKSMIFGLDGHNTLLHVVGEFNQAPLTLNAQMGTDNLWSHTVWPLTADLAYANYRLQVQGKMSLDEKTATIDAYNVVAGSSGLHGQFSAQWGGVRPRIQGTIASDHLTAADFKPIGTGTGGDHEGASNETADPQRVFSATPLDFDGLKSIDAVFDIALSNVTLGNAGVELLTGKLELNSGRLSFPLKVGLGNSTINGGIKLDSVASPAQMSLTLATPSVDLADLLRGSGINPFLSGNAMIAVNLGSAGNSLHAFASNTNGTIVITAARGNVSAAEAGGISSSLMSFFSPQGGTNALNCLAARFIALHGMVKDNGILADTAASLISGKGGLDLGAEAIDMTLSAKPKLVNVGGLLPNLHIGGTFLNPKLGVDSSSVVQGVMGLLASGGNLGSGASDLTAPAGQNACVYTLDHMPVGNGQVYQNLTDQVTDKVKDVGGSLLKGLLGQ